MNWPLTNGSMPSIRAQRWDTFVSFAQEDQSIADLLIHQLRSGGTSVWQPDGTSSSMVSESTAEAVYSSGSFVAIVSKASLRSPAVEFETQIARSFLPDSRIFPVVLAGANLPELPSWLSNRHYLHLSDENHLQPVANALRIHIANLSSPASSVERLAVRGTMPGRRPLAGAETYLNRLRAKSLGVSLLIGPASTEKTALAAEFVYREFSRYAGVHWIDTQLRSHRDSFARQIRSTEKAMRAGHQLLVIDSCDDNPTPRWFERILERHAAKNRILITARRVPNSPRLYVVGHDVLDLDASSVQGETSAQGVRAFEEVLRWAPSAGRGWESISDSGSDESADVLERLALAAFIPDLWVRGDLRREGDEELISLLVDRELLTASANGMELDPQLIDLILAAASSEIVASIARRLLDLLPAPTSADASSLLRHISRFVERVSIDERYFGDSVVLLCIWTGTVWRESGRPQQGLEAAQLATFMSRLRTKPETRLSAFGLAATLAADLGDHHRASQLQQAAIEEAIEMLGFDHPLTLAALADLGNTMRLQGRHAESIAALSHVLARYGESATPSDGRLAVELSLATSYREAGLVEQALEVLDRTIVADPDLKVRVDQERAAALLARGDVADVLPWLQERLQAAESVIERIEALVRVAAAYEKNGQLDAAERSQEEAIALCEVHLGATHPMTLEARQNLALIVGATGRAVDACDILRDVSTKRGEVLGTAHRDYLESVVLWAASAARAGRVDESLALYEQATRQLAETIGERAVGTLKAREQMLRLRVATAAPGTLEDLRALAADVEGVLSAGHPMTSRVRSLLASASRDYASERE
ncbi:tetratricopeptide (TPR) repeat protein [Microbacterium sp. BE35]|uniref:tetratricopeptide repeat protein n=1 Tax=Microbacterium sp. BE35 TaxID=2817773 RepID=UPI0028630F44|nr:toll/interleukin-1 receptor domain-containing protein [Microbacterium sp. BE35]MDR7191007.1 tetratricopeptide (TPR) repeat protein [Microbacterium sp. BE35]